MLNPEEPDASEPELAAEFDGSDALDPVINEADPKELDESPDTPELES